MWCRASADAGGCFQCCVDAVYSPSLLPGCQLISIKKKLWKVNGPQFSQRKGMSDQKFKSD